MTNINLVIYINICLIILFSIYFWHVKEKRSQHYFFIAIIFSFFVYEAGYLFYIQYKETIVQSYYPYFLGIILLPIFILLLALSFTNEQFSFKKQHGWLFFVPLLSICILLTGDYHNLFFINHQENGIYFYLHALYSYGAIFLAVYYSFRSVIKNAGILSRQVLFLGLAILVPFSVNIWDVLIRDSEIFSVYMTRFAFTFSLLFLWIATFRYDLWKVLPAANKNILDHISDGFLVIDKAGYVKEYNKTLCDFFEMKDDCPKDLHVREIFSQLTFQDGRKDLIKEFVENEKILTGTYEASLKKGDEGLYFQLEVNPIVTFRALRGYVVLIKDITEQIKKNELIKENLRKLIKAEKFAFLGEVTGGLTHIIKNKISSIGYYAMFFEIALPRYFELLNTFQRGEMSQKQLELYEGMNKRTLAIKSVVKDMDMMITNVSNQVVELGKEEGLNQGVSFTLGDFLHRMESFIELEAKEQGYFITVDMDEDLDPFLKFEGVLGIFIQGVMNLFANSIYEYKKGHIEEPLILKIKKSSDGSSVEFYVIDFGAGIPKEIKENLFQKVITTKGEEGTGIGLYTTYTAVRDKLKGTLKFLEVEKGATFLITLPIASLNQE